MKAAILKAFRDSTGEYISGSVLCEKFGVSRQAIWKNIAALKEAGYKFDSVSNKGYRLISSPSFLYGPEIQSRMEAECICKKVLSFDVLDSTNVKAKQLAEQGEPEGTLVVAEKQTGGKGRRGRSWSSECGDGIYMSLLVRPKAASNQICGLTLVAALAVAEAITRLAGRKAMIKWPNDVILDGKKICGILTEMSSEEDFVHYVVIGIGINVNTETFPEELAEKATSIYLNTGEKTDRCQLITEIWKIFTKDYQEYLKAKSLAPFLERYQQALVNLGQEVRIYYGMVETAKPEEIETGIAEGVDENGALIVSIDGQKKHIVSGEVSVRGIMDYA